MFVRVGRGEVGGGERGAVVVGDFGGKPRAGGLQGRERDRGNGTQGQKPTGPRQWCVATGQGGVQ